MEEAWQQAAGARSWESTASTTKTSREGDLGVEAKVHPTDISSSEPLSPKGSIISPTLDLPELKAKYSNTRAMGEHRSLKPPYKANALCTESSSKPLFFPILKVKECFNQFSYNQ